MRRQYAEMRAQCRCKRRWIGCPAPRARYRIYSNDTLDKNRDPTEVRTMSQLLDASAKGVYTISATPFTDAGDIDWPSVDSLVEFYLQCGVQGLTVLGMMGEAQKLSDQESAEFTRHFLRRVNGRVPVIVGVSNPGTANLVKLANIAMDAGACGVMVTPLTGLKTE